jgi:hypothetical protein
LFAVVCASASVNWRDWVFAYGVNIVKILLAFGKQEHVLVRFGAAVCYAFRHWVWFVPDYVLPQPPAVGLESEGDAPRDADKVFGFQTIRRATNVFVRSASYMNGFCPNACVIILPFAMRSTLRSVRIAKVKP